MFVLLVLPYNLYNKLERDFQISKHHLISQRENYIMSYTIVSGNKPSSVKPYTKTMQYYLSKCVNKCQRFILNLKMTKIKWSGAEELNLRFKSQKSE